MNDLNNYNIINYRICLDIDLNIASFRGLVIIEVEVLKERNEIILNADDLNVKSCYLVKNNQKNVMKIIK